MGLLALCSAKGSPGVSTLAVGIAALWPRPAALVDLDPAGSDLIWRYRDELGEPLDPGRGLLSLGATVRRAGAVIEPKDHLQMLAGGLPVVAGVTHPGQITGLGPVWPALADALARWPQDVVADCGRVVPGSATVPVLSRADAVVLVVRSGADAFAQLRERLRGLSEVLRLGRPGAVTTSVVLVTADRDRHGTGGRPRRQLEPAGGPLDAGPLRTGTGARAGRADRSGLRRAARRTCSHQNDRPDPELTEKGFREWSRCWYDGSARRSRTSWRSSGGTTRPPP
jgi:hypothetical protein